MEALNGAQLYGLKRILALLKMGMHKELKELSLKQKLALHYVVLRYSHGTNPAPDCTG